MPGTKLQGLPSQSHASVTSETFYQYDIIITSYNPLFSECTRMTEFDLDCKALRADPMAEYRIELDEFTGDVFKKTKVKLERPIFPLFATH